VTVRRAEPRKALTKVREHLDLVVADAAKADDATRLIDTVIERWGRLDVVVNNAGAGAILPVEDATLAAITEIFAVNVFGPSLLVRAALPHLKASGGNIVNVSLGAGHWNLLNTAFESMQWLPARRKRNS
jgi:NAD(P)-dependent dehydrogenase (short-subunit alcohol dehydrogenase family)